MSKEMIVSCTSHETKIAILEDNQLSEVYFERGQEYTLAGSIYKGRVTRVLPGMQSAFVDIGLERAAFLHVLPRGARKVEAEALRHRGARRGAPCRSRPANPTPRPRRCA